MVLLVVLEKAAFKVVFLLNDTCDLCCYWVHINEAGFKPPLWSWVALQIFRHTHIMDYTIPAAHFFKD